ncbi:MAG: hypothetical protein EBQ92_08065 [Proteobacteria bacterium]|nr:hypothetical protein [Pseudomonadota bacterium]
MKPFFALLFGLAAIAAGASKQQAEAFFQKYEFKKSLAEWTELYRKFPNKWEYAKQVANLQLLLEGRPKAVETVRNFPSQQETEISKQIMELSEVFLSEEAQSHYLQALSKTNLNEWNASLSPIKQASALESDNLKILFLKYEIEKHLDLYDQAYETLKAIQKIDSFSIKTKERLAESHIYHGRFSEAESLLETIDRESLSSRGKLALGVSLWELGKKEKAESLIIEVSHLRKPELSHHPVTLWMLYRIASEESEDSQKSQDAKMALKVFLKSSGDEERLLIDGWDPYRLTDHRVALAR